MQNETQESKDGIRSFIVLMDKNKDTQWLEDGKFVDNPLSKPTNAQTICRLFSEITGLPFVKDVKGTIISAGVTQYTVKGYRYASDPDNALVQRIVTVHA